MDTIDFINSLFTTTEQWPMSYAYNEPGLSLPEYHPDTTGIGDGAGATVANTGPVYVSGDIIPGTEPVDDLSAPIDPVLENLSFGTSDEPDDIMTKIYEMFGGMSKYQYKTASNISGALDKLLSNNDGLKARAQVGLYQGALYKTLGAAGDLFTRATAIMAGQEYNIRSAAEIAGQNYQNQMDALDNQVMYMKHQLADRFNKTVETNIMNLAARNIRVNAGNVLELTKDSATEITEDMRTAESNARLRKIALEAGKKQAKEAANLAVKQMWAGFVGSAAKLGIMGATGGGTGESWGNLYKGYVAGKTYLNNNKG